MTTGSKFVSYLSAKYSGQTAQRGRGHVITISREYGCFAFDLAEKIVSKVNQRYVLDGIDKSWSVLSKEIINKSAEDLSMNPEKISYIFEGKKKGLLEDVYDLLSNNNYLSDRRIINSIQHIIKSYAWDGNVIIVGRASCVIAKDVPKSLHVKLVAPLDYRVQKISEKYKLPLNQAKEQVRMTDESRKQFMSFFIGNKSEMEFYDVVINRAKFDEGYIINLITKLADDRGIF